MHHINPWLFFIFIALSIIVCSTSPSKNLIKTIVKEYSKNGGTNIIDSDDHVLKVRKKILHETDDLLVCKGTYDGIPVAIKITPFQTLFDREACILNALDAVNDTNAEANGIPKVYYHGNVFGSTLKAIAMSLFEGTIEQEYNRMTKPFSDFSVLLIFKEAVKTLQYLNTKGVLHNDIKPGNLFLRDTKVFIADFDLSALKGTQGNGFSIMFTSANTHAEMKQHPTTDLASLKLERIPMDDLESLIYSMWHVAGFESFKPRGLELYELRGTDEVVPWLTKICGGFKFEIVQKVFKDIFIEEILSGREVPQYDNIIKLLSDAIDEVAQTSEQTQFDWLPRKRGVFNRILSIVKK